MQWASSSVAIFNDKEIIQHLGPKEDVEMAGTITNIIQYLF